MADFHRDALTFALLTPSTSDWGTMDQLTNSSGTEAWVALRGLVDRFWHGELPEAPEERIELAVALLKAARGVVVTVSLDEHVADQCPSCAFADELQAFALAAQQALRAP